MLLKLVDISSLISLFSQLVSDVTYIRYLSISFCYCVYVVAILFVCICTGLSKMFVMCLLEWEGECNQTVWMLFIDFRVAYDTILRSKLYTPMEGLGIPRKLTRLLEYVIVESKCRPKSSFTVWPFWPMPSLLFDVAWLMTRCYK